MSSVSQSYTLREYIQRSAARGRSSIQISINKDSVFWETQAPFFYVLFPMNQLKQKVFWRKITEALGCYVLQPHSFMSHTASITALFHSAIAG